jgi:hypothetical protein
MQKFKNWLISALLRKDKLVAVPTSWQTEYVKLAGDSVRNKQTIGTLITEYNKLLQDFFNKCSVKELQETLADGEVKFKTSMSKQELADLAYKEFRMTIERD